MLNIKYLYIILPTLLLASCAPKIEPTDGSSPREISAVRAVIEGGEDTRALTYLRQGVGRMVFVEGDSMVLTRIQRTTAPFDEFTYFDIKFVSEGLGVWNRDMSSGHAKGSTEAPERIYWSDAANDHTFIGYSIPQQAPDETFPWDTTTVDDVTKYHGQLRTTTETIGGVSATIVDHRDSAKIVHDDLLLTYNTAMQAETGGSVALIHFKHALACVRVVVNISGFSASDASADSKSRVSSMVLKNMPTKYYWRQISAEAESEPSDNPTCDTHMWIPTPDGQGVGVGRTFTFYSLAVPGDMGEDNAANPEDNLHMQFVVRYPDPMNPGTEASPNLIDHTYTAVMPQRIHFRAGYCTTINITLSHTNESMTIGAEYMDWQFVFTPDEGELRKNSTFLSTTDRSSVTIVGDAKATIDDATWLYRVGEKVQGGDSILDIYGNDGSESYPYVISSANQLLSFAYEVKGGRTFEGQFIKLDADITLQKSVSANDVEWIGIGDDTHPFNGVFSAGFRHINRLYGKPFFSHIGPTGIVDHIFISDALEILGTGSIAEKNEGIICGSYVDGDIVGSAYTPYSGSIVGINTGVLIACSHIGDITCNSDTLGALLGKNDGIIVTCYNVGDCKNTHVGGQAYAGVGAFTPRSVAYCCYFNKDFYSSRDYDDLKQEGTIGHVAFPLTTAEMQNNRYVNQAVIDPQAAITGEITDVRPKSDPFYYHWSLNVGLNRAIAYLASTLASQSGDVIVFHAPGKSDTDPDAGRVTLKRSQVEWLVAHFANQNHEFKFIPAAYPRLE